MAELYTLYKLDKLKATAFEAVGGITKLIGAVLILLFIGIWTKALEVL